METIKSLIFLCSLIGSMSVASTSNIVAMGPLDRSFCEIKTLQVLAKEVAIRHGLPWDMLTHTRPYLAEACKEIATTVLERNEQAQASAHEINTEYSHYRPTQWPREKRNRKAVKKILELHGISGRRASLARFTVDYPKAWSPISAIACTCCISICCTCATYTCCPDSPSASMILSLLSTGVVIPSLFIYAPEIDGAVLRGLLLRTPSSVHAWERNLDQARRVISDDAPCPAKSMNLKEHLKID